MSCKFPLFFKKLKNLLIKPYYKFKKYIKMGSVTMHNKVVINTPIDANVGLTSNSLAKIAFVAAEGMAAIIVHIEITVGL